MFSIEDAEKLTIEEIHDLYGKHTNPSLVKAISIFPFGNELVSHAEGCWIYLKNGDRVLDLTGGIGVLNHGHNHPKILNARKRYASKKRMEVHKSFFSPYIAALGANVSEALLGKLPYSYFPNSGAEAVEGALKIAYKYHEGKRKIVLHAHNSFHGKLLGAASITGSSEIQFEFPSISNTSSFDFNNFDSLKSLIDENINTDGSVNVYAIILEPLVASAMEFCSEEFLIKTRNLCDQLNIILIFDEVYTGWGKTGYLFNFMRVADLWPDVLVYAKSFGGGKASISGYSHNQKLISAYDSIRDSTLHSTTYYGFGEETITAIEAINTIIDEKLVENSMEIGKLLSQLIANSPFPEKSVRAVRGSGGLWGIEIQQSLLENLLSFLQKSLNGKFELFNDPKIGRKIIMGSIVNHLYQEHKILTYFGFNGEYPLIISFPLISREPEVVYAFNALSELFNANFNEILWKFIKLKVFRN